MQTDTTIAFVIPSLKSGGAERVLSTLANEISKQYRVVIITYVKHTPVFPIEPRVKLVACQDNTTPSSNLLTALYANYTLTKKIKYHLKAENASLAIAFLTSTNILATIACKSLKIPVIISERNNPAVEKTPFMWTKLRRLYYPKANFLVVQNTEIADFYKSFIPPANLKVIKNPLSPKLLAERKKVDKEKIILNVGRLTHQKAQDLLIKAFATVHTPGWKLRIIGNGYRAEELKTLIAQLNLTAFVEILPATNRIDEQYNTASIFAFTSVYEGSPNALIEAMAFGLPCISTNCPTGPSELIQNGQNGLLIPMNHQKELEEHLQKLMKDERLRNLLGNEAAKSVKAFEATSISAQWMQLIDSCLTNK